MPRFWPESYGTRGRASDDSTPVNSILFSSILIMAFILLRMLGVHEQEANQTINQRIRRSLRDCLCRSVLLAAHRRTKGVLDG
jgi:hypothetical protein